LTPVQGVGILSNIKAKELLHQRIILGEEGIIVTMQARKWLMRLLVLSS
jgi:hypothetical protein